MAQPVSYTGNESATIVLHWRYHSLTTVLLSYTGLLLSYCITLAYFCLTVLHWLPRLIIFQFAAPLLPLVPGKFVLITSFTQLVSCNRETEGKQP